MVSDLRKVNVLDFETLTSVTAVLNDVTEVKTELTEQAQVQLLPFSVSYQDC